MMYRSLLASVAPNLVFSASYNSLASVICIYTLTRRSPRTLRMHPTKRVVASSNSFYWSAARTTIGLLALIHKHFIVVSHRVTLICHLLKCTPANLSDLNASAKPAIVKPQCL
ncbi:Os05g0312201 [Oryza sativa Japonica Group]|uniref:Os05g0312201 protein n=1 Tax=Oryza sativa subsp. japonica TaxID=39947 RepID=A0A0P0WKS7_ORYSJ|nr:hypothetical protein EE612_028568 [Oryza sativa]BAS93298.1 Os05g0312201 [Oryza sativa Japonica Group]